MPSLFFFRSATTTKNDDVCCFVCGKFEKLQQTNKTLSESKHVAKEHQIRITANYQTRTLI